MKQSRGILWLSLSFMHRIDSSVSNIDEKYFYDNSRFNSNAQGKGQLYQRLLQKADYPGGDADETRFPAFPDKKARVGCCDIETKILGEKVHNGNVGLSQLGVAFSIFVAMDLSYSMADLNLSRINDGQCGDKWSYWRHDRGHDSFTHINHTSPFLDLAPVYGHSSILDGQQREKKNNHLIKLNRFGFFETECFERDSLIPDLQIPFQACTGDPRINSYLPLVAIATLFAREHNRLAAWVERNNSTWSSSKIFNTAKSIVIAEYQNIVIYEWLPRMIGDKNMSLMGWMQNLDTKEGSMIYEETAGASFFSFWSLLTDRMHTISNNNVETIHELKEFLYRPTLLNTTGIEAVIRGQMTHAASIMDASFASDLAKARPLTMHSSLHLPSIFCYTGRDHGIPDYNEVAEYFFTKYKATDASPKLYDAKKLSQIYPHLSSQIGSQNVDLLIGGLAEQPTPAAVLGPTFALLLAEQMKAVKLSDPRFFTKLCANKVFSENECASIRSSTFSSIIIKNTGMQCVGQHAFDTISGGSDANYICRNDLSSVFDVAGFYFPLAYGTAPDLKDYNEQPEDSYQWTIFLLQVIGLPILLLFVIVAIICILSVRIKRNKQNHHTTEKIKERRLSI